MLMQNYFFFKKKINNVDKKYLFKNNNNFLFMRGFFLFLSYGPQFIYNGIISYDSVLGRSVLFLKIKQKFNFIKNIFLPFL